MKGNKVNYLRMDLKVCEGCGAALAPCGLLTVCTAGDVLGDWQSFRLREASMLEAGNGGVCGLWDALRRRRIYWRCAMSAALVILPTVWATASPSRKKTLPEVVEQKKTAPELAFYRKYTEGCCDGM